MRYIGGEVHNIKDFSSVRFVRGKSYEFEIFAMNVADHSVASYTFWCETTQRAHAPHFAFQELKKSLSAQHEAMNAVYTMWLDTSPYLLLSNQQKATLPLLSGQHKAVYTMWSDISKFNFNTVKVINKEMVYRNQIHNSE